MKGKKVEEIRVLLRHNQLSSDGTGTVLRKRLLDHELQAKAVMIEQKIERVLTQEVPIESESDDSDESDSDEDEQEAGDCPRGRLVYSMSVIDDDDSEDSDEEGNA
jgi:hypothetical protein